jgi:predicted SAM-dependent methyltransferase
MLKLNLGCGPCTPDSWLNVDYAMGAWLAKVPILSTLNKKFKIINLNWAENIFIYDLRKHFPWEDNSVDVIYSSHTLEHLSKDEGQRFLEECHRVLKPQGIIRIVVPDLKAIVNRYVHNEIDADNVLDELGVSYSSSTESWLKQKLAPFIRFPHKCMYDSPALLRIMSSIGFEVKSKEAFESVIDNLEEIEQPERTDTSEAVIIEGTKLHLRQGLLGETQLTAKLS